MSSSQNPIRVRFAPSPTGFMHIGNVRTALMNTLFAKQKNGTYVLRLEDTDATRNVDPMGKQILADLKWLGLEHQEGPDCGGPYAPYAQSQRAHIYKSFLEELKNKNLIYRCFCSHEELEKKRARQVALKQPPRYDRTCLNLNASQAEVLAQTKPYVWRFKLDNSHIIVRDLAHGELSYELNNFSDFTLTRPDHSFTFLFANCVDDMTMHITHIIRGEDHLSNTALQAALYKAFNAPIPTFWHLPILCNELGKKLSKRDFGFSLNDLKEAGFLPEAINNYLATLGASFEHEIMDFDTLYKILNFDAIHSTGPIRYHVDKLKWINHEWIKKLSIDELYERARPFLTDFSSELSDLSNLADFKKLLETIRDEIITLADIQKLTSFYFKKPELTPCVIERIVKTDSSLITKFNSVFTKLSKTINLETTSSQELLTTLKEFAKQEQISFKNLCLCLRVALTGNSEGLGIQQLFDTLSVNEIYKRLKLFTEKTIEQHPAQPIC